MLFLSRAAVHGFCSTAVFQVRHRDTLLVVRQEMNTSCDNEMGTDLVREEFLESNILFEAEHCSSFDSEEGRRSGSCILLSRMRLMPIQLVDDLLLPSTGCPSGG